MTISHRNKDNSENGVAESERQEEVVLQARLTCYWYLVVSLYGRLEIERTYCQVSISTNYSVAMFGKEGVVFVIVKLEAARSWKTRNRHLCLCGRRDWRLLERRCSWKLM